MDVYYEKTTDLPAYIMAMCMLSHFSLCLSTENSIHAVLNPKEKMAHFKKHWSEDLQQEVLDCAEEVVCGHSFSSSKSVVLKNSCGQWPCQFQEQYKEMNKSGPSPVVEKKKKSGIKSLLHELSDDEDDSDTTPIPSDNSDTLWHVEFHRYLDATHEFRVL